MPIQIINSIIKPEVKAAPGFRDVINQTIRSFDCEIMRSTVVDISYDQIHELYEHEIAEEKIPDYDQLRNQFELGESEIIELSTDLSIEILREKMIGHLGEAGIRGAFLEYRTSAFWATLGYQAPPDQSDPAWWRFNAIHMPKNEEEQNRLSKWINRHDF